MIRALLAWALAVYREARDAERAVRPFRDLDDGRAVWEARRPLYQRVADRWAMPKWQHAAMLACQSQMPQGLDDEASEAWLDLAAALHVEADRHPWGEPR